MLALPQCTHMAFSSIDGGSASSPHPYRLITSAAGNEGQPAKSTQPPPPSSSQQSIQAVSTASRQPQTFSQKAKLRKDRQPSLNPFQPLMAEGPGWVDSNSEGYTSNKRRWSHLFHTCIYRTVGQAEYNYAPNWKSLCEPASLPITTDYKPDPSELNTRFVEANHLLNDAGLYSARTEELLRELVAQRLMQGYQLVVPPKSRKSTVRPPPAKATPPAKAPPPLPHHGLLYLISRVLPGQGESHLGPIA